MRADRGERRIERLRLPLSIIATDIGSGERVVFREGSLTQAMRASMSCPGWWRRWRSTGASWSTAGWWTTCRSREVRERCGAEVVIAVNVGSPLLNASDIESLLSVSAQMVALLTEQNVTRSLQLLGPRDIYIRPGLDGIGARDFARFEASAQAGARLPTTSPTRCSRWPWTLATGANGPTRCAANEKRRRASTRSASKAWSVCNRRWWRAT